MKEIFDKLKNIKKDNYLITLIIFAIICCCVFVGHYNNILIDFGREVLYPERILSGKILYKDLFNIYGPFSYLANALFYKIFGTKLSTLYILGSILGTTLIATIYKISRLFLNKIYSFLIGIFVVSVGICTTVIFNFTFPYSWGMLYGTVFFLISLYFMLKHIKTENQLAYYLTPLFAGFAVSNKYEFIPFCLLIVYFIFGFSKKSITKILLSISCFLAPIILCFGILFAQGLNFNQLITSFSIVKTMASTQTLKYFYINHGNMFSYQAILLDILVFLAILFTNSFNFLGIHFKEKNKILSGLMFFIGFVLTTFTSHYAKFNLFIYLPILFIILYLFKRKSFENKSLYDIFALATVLFSLKSISALMIFSYGSYYIGLYLIGLFIVLNDKLRKTLAVFITTLTVIFTIQGFLNIPKESVETPKGKIYTPNIKATSQVIDYISKIDKNDKVLILPEGMTINFLSNRLSDDFYNSFIPLYIETFTEEKLINHYKISKPEYIILNNQNMKDYGFNYICNDYALNFCAFIVEEYEFDTDFSDMGNRYLIYKRK